jgi:hypothetical protein
VQRSVDIRRVVTLALTGTLVLVAAWEFAFLYPYIDSQHAVGTDYSFYRAIGERWLDTGQFYLPHQLTGPYTVQTDVDVLYPPIAIPFFAALRWLPFPLWWIIPLGAVGVVLVRLRPAAWTWPILLFCLAWPRNLSDLIYGNSNMWVVAAVAGGVVWGWPAILVALKPSLVPFALVGIRRRSWWIAATVLGLASLATIGLWHDYLAVVNHSDARWYWSIEDIIPTTAPVVMWLGRRDGGFRTLADVATWRPGRPRRTWLGWIGTVGRHRQPAS